LTSLRVIRWEDKDENPFSLDGEGIKSRGRGCSWDSVIEPKHEQFMYEEDENSAIFENPAADTGSAS